MKKKIHVNQHNIRANKRDGGNRPVITCKTSAANVYGHSVEVLGDSMVTYRPDSPLSCGAKCWVETDHPVIVYVFTDEGVEAYEID